MSFDESGSSSGGKRRRDSDAGSEGVGRRQVLKGVLAGAAALGTFAPSIRAYGQTGSLSPGDDDLIRTSTASPAVFCVHDIISIIPDPCVNGGDSITAGDRMCIKCPGLSPMNCSNHTAAGSSPPNRTFGLLNAGGTRICRGVWTRANNGVVQACTICAAPNPPAQLFNNYEYVPDM